ncbi:HAD-IA family hydrolase, partial [Candidatus Dependentiae bacterium]|nr:HAD-IA family hydrolase [Candidatus Dependentiae bacterium]
SEARKEVTNFFYQWSQKETSFNQNELHLIKGMSETFFEPTAIARCFTLETGLAKLLQQVACNSTITNYVLSNWDPESFNLIYKKYEDTIFSAIRPSHIVISGSAGSLKPQQSLFHYFLTKYDLTPQSCFFIDDQADNIAAAQNLGIEGITFEVNHVERTEQALRNLKAL